jgi:ribonuclease D
MLDVALHQTPCIVQGKCEPEQKELREQFEAALKAIWAYRDKQAKRYAVPPRKVKKHQSS